MSLGDADRQTPVRLSVASTRRDDERTVRRVSRGRLASAFDIHSRASSPAAPASSARTCATRCSPRGHRVTCVDNLAGTGGSTRNVVAAARPSGFELVDRRRRGVVGSRAAGGLRLRLSSRRLEERRLHGRSRARPRRQRARDAAPRARRGPRRRAQVRALVDRLGRRRGRARRRSPDGAGLLLRRQQARRRVVLPRRSPP